VQDSVLVGVMHGTGYAGDQPSTFHLPTLRKFCIPYSAFCNPLSEAASFDKLHAEIVLALVLVNLVDRDDVRVIEVGGRFGFGAKTLHVLWRGKLACENHLQRDDTI
jgi:hypothetical protein